MHKSPSKCRQQFKIIQGEIAYKERIDALTSKLLHNFMGIVNYLRSVVLCVLVYELSRTQYKS